MKNKLTVKFTDENEKEPLSKTFSIDSIDELTEILAKIIVIVDGMKNPSNKLEKVELNFCYVEENGV